MLGFKYSSLPIVSIKLPSFESAVCEFLSSKGLNLQAVFNLDELPEPLMTVLREQIPDKKSYRQLILLAHGGRALWDEVTSSDIESENPIDDFSIEVVHQLFRTNFETASYEILYPGDKPINLQKLGELAGWHYPSPFRIGVNNEWGSWFAYRAVILTDTDFITTQPVAFGSPCDGCQTRPCVEACPAEALIGGALDLNRCIEYRLTADSKCKDRCLARLACPAKVEHRYSEEQVAYHYGKSMKMIEAFEFEKSKKP